MPALRPRRREKSTLAPPGLRFTPLLPRSEASSDRVRRVRGQDGGRKLGRPQGAPHTPVRRAGGLAGPANGQDFDLEFAGYRMANGGFDDQAGRRASAGAGGVHEAPDERGPRYGRSSLLRRDSSSPEEQCSLVSPIDRVRRKVASCKPLLTPARSPGEIALEPEGERDLSVRRSRTQETAVHRTVSHCFRTSSPLGNPLSIHPQKRQENQKT